MSGFRSNVIVCLIFLLTSTGLRAAVVVDLGPGKEDDASDIIKKNINNLMPDEAMNDPTKFLPETFKLDIGQQQGANMNPLVRKFYSRLSRKDVPGALLVLEDLQETQFLNPKLYTTQAQLLIFLRKYDEARAAARQAIRYDQSYIRAHKMLAFINILDGEIEVAIADLFKALEFKEDDTEVLKLAAFGFMHKNDLAGATRIFAHIARLDDQNPRAHADLGNAWLKAGENDYAVLALRRAVDLAPQVPTYYNDLGTAFVSQGKLSDALNAYAMALKFDPFYSPALSNMGVLVYNDGQVEAGLKLLTTACEVDISSNMAWNNLVLTLNRVFPILTGHTANRPDAGSYILLPDRQFYTWGVYYAQQRNHQAAQSHIIRALRENPADPEYMNDLGSLFAGTGGVKLARVMFRRALETYPDFRAAQNNLLMVEKQINALEGTSKTTPAKPVHTPITLP